MKLFYLPILLICYFIPSTGRNAPVDNIADLIKQGNSSELALLFSPNINFNILGDENMYSKAQAEIVLNKFFSQYKPKSVRALHNISSNPNYRFGVLILTTNNGKFRVAYTLKGENGNLMMIEMRIETEKVK